MTKYYLIVITILLVCVSVLSKCNTELKADAAEKNQTIVALTDSLKTVKNADGTTTASKAVFTERIAADSKVLNKAQKQLFKAVDKNTLAAVHIIDKVTIHDAVNTTPVVSNDSVQVFKSVSDTLSYTITVTPGKLSIDTLEVLNTALITIKQDKKNVIVSITNTNPLLSTNDVQGYVIPKEHLSLWKKIKRFIFNA